MAAELGKRYRDKISGFEGTATGRSIYLYGCEQILLVAADEGNVEPKSYWFDEQRLVDDALAVSGGPQSTPPARTAPH